MANHCSHDLRQDDWKVGLSDDFKAHTRGGIPPTLLRSLRIVCDGSPAFVGGNMFYIRLLVSPGRRVGLP